MTKNILITGATGYIGGCLLKILENSDHHIKCLARKPEFLKDKVSSNIVIIKGDLFNKQRLNEALQNVDIAYYLVHSMGSNKNFAQMDRIAAQNFSKACKKNKVKKVIYLGALGDDINLSAHLKSRQEVGKILRLSTPTIEFRASIIIGPGSLSFELVRSLTERLPVMLTPKWLRTKTQPISILDVVEYLIKAIDLDISKSCIYEIGGAEVVTYENILQEYAKQRNLKRYLIPVPFLTPNLSAFWIGLVTPIYARIGKKMVAGLKNETILKNNLAQQTFNVEVLNITEAIHFALEIEKKGIKQSYWADAVSSSGCTADYCNVEIGTRFVELQKIRVKAPKEIAFMPILTIGGNNGWYFANFLWKIRGYIDLCFGGAGLRRGRRDPNHLFIGDILDWWRVEDFKKYKLLRLYSEMKLPGQGWLEFEIKEKPDYTEICQSAIFYPKGLTGILYWYLLYPIHWLIFRGMLLGIKSKIEKLTTMQ